MGSLGAGPAQSFENFPGIKIHTSVYKVLGKIVDGVISLIPAIESAQPGCTLGIQELCSLNIFAEKAKQLILQCAESSKLYSVITGGASISRCERIRDAIERSLRHIHSMVPEPLTTKIDDFLDFLNDAKFKINTSEEEAGKALLSLLRQADTTEDSELTAFQIASSSLNLTSSTALLVERRCIRKSLDKLTGADAKKERILKYFMYLLDKYGRKVLHENSGCKENVDETNVVQLGKTSSSCDVGSNEKICTALEASHKNHQDDCRTDVSNTDSVPEEFRCPLSNRLMNDPVIISSGQTYERMFIEKWLNDGHDTCPKTHKKLTNFCMVPNSSLKSLICQWCRKHDPSMQDPISHPFLAAFQTCNDLHSTSISSINSVSSLLLENKIADYVFHSDHSNLSLISAASCYSDSSHVRGIENNADAHYPMFKWSEDYQRFESFAHFTYDSYMKFFRELSELSLDMHIKALENLKYLFGVDDTISRLMLSNGFIDALMKFLQDAYDSSNVTAQKVAVQILLAFMDNTRVDIPYLSDDACRLLTCLLDSEFTLEALMVMQKLCSLPDCNSNIVASDVSHSILKALNSQDTKCINIAMEILRQLSSIREIEAQILSSKNFPKLVSFLREKQLAGCCLRLLRILSDRVEGRSAISEAIDCIASISELLESCNLEEKTDAVAILLSLCSHSQDYSLLVMKEGIIPSLVDMSINGNLEGQEKSKKLLNLLRDLRQNDCQECTVPSPGSILPSITAFDCPPSPNNHSKKRNPTSKASGFFGRKIFFKPKYFPLF